MRLTWTDGGQHPRRPWWTASYADEAWVAELVEYGMHSAGVPLPIWKRRDGARIVLESVKAEEQIAEADRDAPIEMTEEEALVVAGFVTTAATQLLIREMGDSSPPIERLDYSLREMADSTRMARLSKPREWQEGGATRYEVRVVVDDRLLALLYTLWHYEPSERPIMTWKPPFRSARGIFIVTNRQLEAIAGDVRANMAPA